MIIPVWKKIGESTHMLAQKVGDELEEKATHTGTLDPMAEGVVVVLTGEDRFKKGTLNWNKTYNFKMLTGVETDSHDLLGLQTNLINKKLSKKVLVEQIVDKLNQFQGSQKQVQPKFSAQRIAGRAAFNYSKENSIFSPQSNTIFIHHIKLQKSEYIELDHLLYYIEQNIALVSGEFRQKDILNNWNLTIESLREQNIYKLPLITLEAKVSKRTYVRSLTRDLSKKINIPATTFSITRIKEGPYSKKSCQSYLANLLQHAAPKI